MGKELAKEFLVGKPTKKKIVTLAFCKKSVSFELSYAEWENIVRFTAMTLKKKFFTSRARGYINFKIDKNEYKYQKYNQKDFFSQSFLFVNFILGRAKVQLHLDEFIRFQKFCATQQVRNVSQGKVFLS